MLILIAGITGNIGQHAARMGFGAGHNIRGLGRSPDKLTPELTSCLESFVVSANYYDIAALDKACQGVDAVICAYSGLPELHLDGQLLLLRAAERAGIRRFLAAGWNYDWRNTRDLPSDERGSPVYDAAIAFHRHVAMTSSIKPCHIFSGMLAEVFFGLDGQTGFTPKDNGVWEPEKPKDRKSMDIWGTGDEPWNFATEKDCGRWGIEVITRDGAEEGGFFTFASWTLGLNEVKDIYERVRDTKVTTTIRGDAATLKEIAVRERNELGLSRMWEWHRYWFHLFCVTGIWNLTGTGNGFDRPSSIANLEKFLRYRQDV